ncbi:MAG: LysR family transcriptional regulator [Chloroflexi bacterium]|nr:LysR family transcriptional regulator [Chloroflexota bacterium]
MSTEPPHLDVFPAVAGCGNITRASRQLVISQLSVSVQIRALERACELPLLDRQPRGDYEGRSVAELLVHELANLHRGVPPVW